MTEEQYEIIRLIAAHPSCTQAELARILELIDNDRPSANGTYHLVIHKWPMYENRDERSLNKIPPIKAIRAVTRLNLKESKDHIENCYQGENTPVIVFRTRDVTLAEQARTEFIAAGCEVSVELANC